MGSTKQEGLKCGKCKTKLKCEGKKCRPMCEKIPKDLYQLFHSDQKKKGEGEGRKSMIQDQYR